VTVWNPATGQLLRRIPGMAQRTYALAWSPDGGTLAAGGGIPGELGEARVFDAATGDLKSVAHQAGDVVLDVQYDANGTQLAVADADNLITVYYAGDFSTRLRIDNHSGWVMALAFSPDLRFLASASRDRSAKIFEIKTGEPISTYGGHGAPVLGVAFRADGKQVFSSGRGGKIHVWKSGLADIDGKRFGAEKVAEIAGLGREVYKLVLHGDLVFSVSADGKARVHQATDRRLVREFAVDTGSDWLQSLAFHPPSGRLATGVHDGTVRVWDTKTGKLLKAFTASPR
jgi:WD40 repeat protein